MDGQERMVIKRLLMQVCESFALARDLNEKHRVESTDKNGAPFISVRLDWSATTLVSV